MDVEIRTIEWATLLKEWVRKRRFEAIVLGWGIGNDPDQFNIWHSSKTGPDDFNTISFANAEVDELLEKGRTTCVQAERAHYYHRMHESWPPSSPSSFCTSATPCPWCLRECTGSCPGRRASATTSRSGTCRGPRSATRPGNGRARRCTPRVNSRKARRFRPGKGRR